MYGFTHSNLDSINSKVLSDTFSEFSQSHTEALSNRFFDRASKTDRYMTIYVYYAV